MALRHVREHGREVGRAEGQRNGHSQAATKIAGGQDRFPGDVDLGTDPRRMIPKRYPSLSQGSAAGRTCQKLDAEVRFEPGEPPPNDRLGDAQPSRGGRNASGIGDLDECPEFFSRKASFVD
ncbi:hypothetical protein J2X71_006263 [Rhizobium sp. 1399]|nr:hypothetical protein [Rhizobium sp. 1399]